MPCQKSHVCIPGYGGQHLFWYNFLAFLNTFTTLKRDAVCARTHRSSFSQADVGEGVGGLCVTTLLFFAKLEHGHPNTIV